MNRATRIRESIQVTVTPSLNTKVYEVLLCRTVVFIYSLFALIIVGSESFDHLSAFPYLFLSRLIS